MYKIFSKITICLTVVIWTACNTDAEPKPMESDSLIIKPTDTINQTAGNPANKNDLLSIGLSIIDKGGNDLIRNLHSVDSVLFVLDDYFINEKEKSKVAYLSGIAGGSAGIASNLIIVFGDTTTNKVLYSAQVGIIDPDEIRDYNGDGLKDFIINSGMVWMGECNSSYAIKNFKGGQENILYSANSYSVIGCGQDENQYRFETGDTLSIEIENNLTKAGDEYIVGEKQTISIYNGGKTENDILARLKRIVVSKNIKL